MTAVIDTGSTDYLTLPRERIHDLRLEFRQRKPYLIADEKEATFDTYAAFVEFDGETFEIDVLEQEGVPLIGMTLLMGCRLSVHITTGGEVTVERTP